MNDTLATPDVDERQDPAEPAPRRALTVVGIGASAGGLEALRVLLQSLPTSGGAAFVVIQHLSPKHKSLLSELLTPPDGLVVQEIESGIKVQADTVYVAPPNTNVRWEDGKLWLDALSATPGPTPSVDHFLRSLAMGVGEHAAAVILSGTGTDGSEGVRAVKAAGGVVFVQEPEDAKYDGMPKAAIATKQVDLVIKPAAIGAAIASLASAEGLDADKHREVKPSQMGQIAETVREAAGLNLGYYKAATLSRRIQRRIDVHGLRDLDAYQDMLEDSPEECVMLAREMLISVTEFLRDPDAYDLLRRELMVRLKKPKNDTFRVWIPGCATGEEAYSIAMLYHDVCKELDVHARLIIFATDVDEGALEIARNASYPAAAFDKMPEALRTAYTETDRKPGHVRIRKKIRQCLVISRQNVVDDPPFSRLDMVSCRNLMIYLVPDAQRRVMERIHYALHTDGLLFLGSSESGDAHSDLFRTISRQAHLFAAREGGVNSILPGSLSQSGRTTRRREEALQARQSIAEQVRDTMVSELLPAAVLLDGADVIRHFRGELRNLMRFPDDAGELRFFDMVETSFRAELRALVSRARREGGRLAGRPIVVTRKPDAEHPKYLRPSAIRMDRLPELYRGSTAGQLDAAPVLLAFEVVTAAPAAHSQSDDTHADAEPLVRELERELSETRAHLQTVVEELETSNEELQSQSEELQSSNEELQTTNEELQTTNEELQTTNEELQTVNDSLEQHTTQLDDTIMLLNQLKESMPMSVLVVDHNLRVILHNSSARDLANFPADHAEEFPSLLAGDWDCDVDIVLAKTRHVLRDKTAAHAVLDTTSHQRLLLQVAPFLQRGNQHGAVLSFTDTSSQRDSERAMQYEKERVQILLESIGDAVVGLDSQGKVTYLNPAFLQIFAHSEDELLGLPFTKIIHDAPESSTPKLVAAIKDQLADPTRNLEKSDDYTLSLSSGDSLAVYGSFTRLRSTRPDQELAGASDGGLVLVLRDFTDQRVLTEQLSFQASHDPLTALLNRAEFMRLAKRAQEDVHEGRAAHTLLYMDLDNFKLINDQCGHAAGDDLLRQVAAMLRDQMRSGDMVGRVGGDEFAAILANCPMDRAERICDEIVQRILQFEFRWNDRIYRVGVSVGVTDIDGESRLAEVISRADSACYAAKQAGRGQWKAIHFSDRAATQEYSDLQAVAKVTRAIENDQLLLAVEPIASITDSSQIAYREVLVRMRDDAGQVLLPCHFIAAAERYLIAPQIDRWVLEHGLAYMQNHAGDFGFNLSGVSLGDKHFCSTVTALIGDSGVEARRIVFEITETHAVHQMDDAIRFIDQMKALGCRFALDDFGVGVSSFNYLKNLDVDFLKIDGGFIRNLGEDLVDRKMVEAIHSIGQEMQIKTIAEHVEREALVPLLADIGVDYMQGYWAGKATMLEEIGT